LFGWRLELIDLLTGCGFDAEKEMASCKAAYPTDDDAMDACFSRAQQAHRVGIAGVFKCADDPLPKG
jgi:hypothetical protein